MSLIVAVYVPTGVALSGDSRTTRIVSQPQLSAGAPNSQIVQTQSVVSDATHKLFVVFGRYAIGTFGAAFAGPMPIAHHIDRFEVSKQAQPPATTSQCATALLQHFQNLSPTPDTTFVVVGYDTDEPFVYGVGVLANSTRRWNIDTAKTPHELTYGVLHGGDNAIVLRLLSQSQFNPAFPAMNLQDAVDFSRHLIRTTIDQMRFEPRFPTVGGDIDTIVVTHGGVNFLQQKQLHI